MIGRQEETKLLRRALSKKRSSMIAVIGRRRIGKTYMMETVYKDHMAFNLIGQEDAERELQLQNFTEKLTMYSASSQALKKPDNWREAFNQLKAYLEERKGSKKKVIFFDELPWLDTHRSGFLPALSYFWNDWAIHQNIVVVICGSAASWMIDKVINNKGGLHNRINYLIELEPFTLNETKQFLRKRQVRLDDYQISQLYMTMGGVPHYLEQIQAGQNATQNIQYICFSKNGMLRNEFENLYSALFDRPEGHIRVVRILSSKWKGLTRKEIIEQSDFTNGGGLTKIISELVRSSFISAYQPFGKKKRETLYRLTDEYSLFYLTFIENSAAGDNQWQQLSRTPKVNAWQGYAFESLCLKHIFAIKTALGISGLNTIESGYIHKADDTHDGLQVDLVIDRPDSAIHLVEMKYYNTEFAITKEYARKLRSRKAAFQYFTKSKKFLFTTVITTYGLNHNLHSLGLVDHVITIDQLFVK